VCTVSISALTAQKLARTRSGSLSAHFAYVFARAICMSKLVGQRIHARIAKKGCNAGVCRLTFPRSNISKRPLSRAAPISRFDSARSVGVAALLARTCPTRGTPSGREAAQLTNESNSLSARRAAWNSQLEVGVGRSPRGFSFNLEMFIAA